jgi:hypothetical protein
LNRIGLAVIELVWGDKNVADAQTDAQTHRRTDRRTHAMRI